MSALKYLSLEHGAFILFATYPHVHLPLWRPQLEASRALQVQHHRKPWPCSSPMAAPTTPALSERQRRLPRPGDERTGSRPWLSSLLYPSQVPVASCSLYPVTISRFHLCTFFFSLFPVPRFESPGHRQLISSSTTGSSLNIHNC